MNKKIIAIKNENLTVEISTKGAELQSVKSNDGTQFLWYGDEKFWPDRAPLLFPICGGLKDDKYVFEGKKYSLQKHGYAMFCEFEIEYQTKTEAVFLHKSNEQTLAQYPFEYELRVKYLLNGNTLDVVYEIINLSNKKMYFSIGAHEGYLCPEGIDEYSIVFEKEETLNHCVVENGLLTDKTIPFLENAKVFNLKNEYYSTIDTLAFKNLVSKELTLKHNNGSRRITLNFDGFPYLLLWTKQNAPYICIEPWCGITDKVGTDGDITKKTGIESVNQDEKYIKKHSITFKSQ